MEMTLKKDLISQLMAELSDKRLRLYFELDAC